MGISSEPFDSQLPAETAEYALESGLSEEDWLQFGVEDKQFPVASYKTAIDLTVLMRAGFTNEDLEVVGPFVMTIHSLDEQTPAMEVPMLILSLFAAYDEQFNITPSASVLDAALENAEPVFNEHRQYGSLTDWLATTLEYTYGIALRSDE